MYCKKQKKKNLRRVQTDSFIYFISFFWKKKKIWKGAERR